MPFDRNDIKISALIFTRNEEDRVKELLESIKDIVDEIVVIDGCSSDRTVDIASEYTNKIYKTIPVGYVEPCRMFGLSKVSYNYVLYLDCDERLNMNLAMGLKKIVTVMDLKKISALQILRRNYVKRYKYLKHLFSPDFKIHVFKKDKVKYKGIIHEQPIIEGKIAKTSPKYWIDHFALELYSFKGLKERLVKYAYLVAMQREDKKRSFVLALLMPVTIMARLGKYLLLKGSFLDGIEGLRAALVYIIYLQIADILKAFRTKKWDEISKIANTRGLSFLCNACYQDSLRNRA